MQTRDALVAVHTKWSTRKHTISIYIAIQMKWKNVKTTNFPFEMRVQSTWLRAQYIYFFYTHDFFFERIITHLIRIVLEHMKWHSSTGLYTNKEENFHFFLDHFLFVFSIPLVTLSLFVPKNEISLSFSLLWLSPWKTFPNSTMAMKLKLLKWFFFLNRKSFFSAKFWLDYDRCTEERRKTYGDDGRQLCTNLGTDRVLKKCWRRRTEPEPKW